MSYFTRDRIQFYFQEQGVGVPFVFQHGLGADVTQPFALFNPPPGFRLLAFDCRAHGRTHPPGPVADIGLSTFADDLIALLEEVKVRRAVVGGISMGAAVALNCALRYPDRVLGLVLSRPAWLAAPNPWNVRIFTLISRLLREHGAREGRRIFEQTQPYLETAARWPDVAKSLAQQFDHPEAEQTSFKFERIINDTPCGDRTAWARIRVPTLILANHEDPIHPFEYGEVLAHGIPGAELRELTSKSVSLAQHERDVQQHVERFLLEHARKFHGGSGPPSA